MQSKDPEITRILADPANINWIKDTIGLTEIVVPGEDSRAKQMREIAQLLQSGPIQSATPDPMTGAMVPKTMPSIGIDELFDEHAVEFGECVRWANSDAGQQAKIDDPQGFENVRAHALMHKQAMMRKQAMMANAPDAKAAASKNTKAPGMVQAAPGNPALQKTPGDINA